MDNGNAATQKRQVRHQWHHSKHLATEQRGGLHSAGCIQDMAAADSLLLPKTAAP